jgi:hypothetical protein
MPWPLVIFRLFYAVAMLILPGYLVARLARFEAKFSLAFPLSSVILFCTLFWIHTCGFSLTFIHAAVVELVLCAALIAITKKPPLPGVLKIPTRWMPWERIFLIFGIATAFLLVWRSLMAPLEGSDTYFRWDFLARQILAFGRFDFYPPIKSPDFHQYFYIDSIPPMVSFTYWWLYAAAGANWSKLTAIPVLLQYLSVLGLTFNIARHFGGVRAASFAVAALASSSLFFHDVIIAQETGLTALALAGVLYALCLHGDAVRGSVLGGAMVALAAMSREYGWAFLFCGCISLAPVSKKNLVLFILTPLLLAGPWYVRTWWLSGNPFYSLPFFGMDTNPVFSALLHFYRQHLGITKWTLGNWESIAVYLLETAALPCTLGIAGLVILLRSRSNVRHAAVFIVAFFTIVALWLYSVGDTSGGPWYGIRILSPALLVLSITSGIAYAQMSRPMLIKMIWTCAAVCALIAAWIYPMAPSTLAAKKWFAFGLNPFHTLEAEQVGPLLSKSGFPASQQILSADALLYAGLLRDGYTVTPPWRPDLSFLFDPQVSAAESLRRLMALHICAVEFDPNSINTIFFYQNSNFFHDFYHDPSIYRPVIQTNNWGILLLSR